MAGKIIARSLVRRAAPKRIKEKIRYLGDIFSKRYFKKTKKKQEAARFALDRLGRLRRLPLQFAADER